MTIMSGYASESMFRVQKQTVKYETTMVCPPLTTFDIRLSTATFNLVLNGMDEPSGTYDYAPVNKGSSCWGAIGVAPSHTFSNEETIEFNQASGGDWGTIVAVAVTTEQLGSATPLFGGPLVTPINVQDGFTAMFLVGLLSLSFSTT